MRKVQSKTPSHTTYLIYSQKTVRQVKWIKNTNPAWKLKPNFSVNISVGEVIIQPNQREKFHTSDSSFYLIPYVGIFTTTAELVVIEPHKHLFFGLIFITVDRSTFKILFINAWYMVIFFMYHIYEEGGTDYIFYINKILLQRTFWFELNEYLGNSGVLALI